MSVSIQRVWLRKSSSIPGGESTHYPRPRNRSTADGYHVLEFCFENAVEVLRGADAGDCVCVGEGGEDADSTGE